MGRRKKLIALLFVVLALTVLMADSCQKQPASTAKDQTFTNNELTRLQNALPPPDLGDYSLERDLLIQLYYARNDARTTYSVITSQGTGAPLYVCPSIGYPIPADTQITNPSQKVGNDNGNTTIEQAEPNGLYTSKNTDGTYVMCVDGAGRVTPVYAEQKVITYTKPVKIVNGQIVVDDSADPSIELKPKTP